MGVVHSMGLDLGSVYGVYVTSFHLKKTVFSVNNIFKIWTGFDKTVSSDTLNWLFTSKRGSNVIMA